MLKWVRRPSDSCACGRRLPSPEAFPAGRHREVRCFCGRRAAYASTAAGWALQASLTPEASVPIQGFSRELKLAPDVERFWFLHPIGGANLPVHIVFSSALRIAEIKAADQKALRLANVASASEARRMWIERHDSARGLATAARPAIDPSREGAPSPAISRL